MLNKLEFLLYGAIFELERGIIQYFYISVEDFDEEITLIVSRLYRKRLMLQSSSDLLDILKDKFGERLNDDEILDVLENSFENMAKFQESIEDDLVSIKDDFHDIEDE